MATKKKATRKKTGWEFYKVPVNSARRTAIVVEQWRWRFRARNGKITKASTESYSRKIDCIANARASGYTG